MSLSEYCQLCGNWHFRGECPHDPFFTQLPPVAYAIHKPEIHLKGWGREEWVLNDPPKGDIGGGLCMKQLVFNKGKRCSWHYHRVKYEVFQLLSGKLELKYGWTDDINNATTITLEPGDCIRIPQFLRHQMFAVEDSVLLEVSTHHMEDDSISVIKGD